MIIIHYTSPTAIYEYYSYGHTFNNSPVTIIVHFACTAFVYLLACDKIYSYMKEMEMELPTNSDMDTVARVKRLHFYSVREEFLIIWRYNEQFLMEYEERLVRQVQKQARIGRFSTQEGAFFTKKKQNLGDGGCFVVLICQFL